MWINDGDDGGNHDYSEGNEDVPDMTLFIDGTNAFVDGVCDFLDFFPVHIDAQALFTFLESREEIRTANERGDLTIKLSQADDAVNVVWTSLTRSESGAYQTQNITGCGEWLRKTFINAASEEVPSFGLELPPAFIELMRKNPEQGVILLEGRKRSSAPLVLGLYYDEDICVWKTELQLNILPVEEMYGKIDLRSIGSASRQDASLPHNPAAPNVLFLHGFNVSATEARGWHAEIYKRLYQAGLDMNFYGVTWRGDEALSETLGLPALHYHRNVYNAFKTAPVLAAAVAQLPPASQTAVLAHSLGNMVVSEAINTYGFKPDTYVLLNAAIPSEAFDPTLQDAEANETTLVPQAWREYDSRTYAARWNELFAAAEPQSKMTWAGCFANISQKSPKTQFYNFYSEGDEVFELRSDIESGILPPQYAGTLYWQFEGRAPWNLLATLFPEPTFGRHAWQKQEFLKGTHAIFGTADGGWAFAMNSTIDASGVSTGTPVYDADEANILCTTPDGRDTLKVSPVFSATDMMLYPSPNAQQQQDERYKILAYRIPALSPAMGRTSTLSSGASVRFEMRELEVSKPWPREGGAFPNDWLHSDIKNMAFYYIFERFKTLRTCILSTR